MTPTEKTILQTLTTLLKHRLDEAQERRRTAQHDDMKRYYKAQADTLNMVLRDLETVIFESGLEGNLKHAQQTFPTTRDIVSAA